MYVRLLTSRVTAHFSQTPGEVIEVSVDDGRRMIAAGQAEAVAEAPQTMSVYPTENAALPKPRRGRPPKVRI